MALTIKRLHEADAGVAHAFLSKLFKEDPETGGEGAPTADFLAAQVNDGLASWLAFDGSKLLGVLGPRQGGIRVMPDGGKRTFHHYNRLAVDYGLYKESRGSALDIALKLTVAAADDAKKAGELPDDIRAVGPTNSRGSSFCRLLGFEEIRRGRESEFWLETELIWERCKAAEALT